MIKVEYELAEYDEFGRVIINNKFENRMRQGIKCFVNREHEIIGLVIEGINDFNDFLEFKNNTVFNKLKVLAIQNTSEAWHILQIPYYELKIFIAKNTVIDDGIFGQMLTLEELYLEQTNINDLLDISKLCNLKHLSLIRNKIDNIDLLEKLYLLEELVLNYNIIRDISVFSTMKNLKKLILEGNNITNILPLDNLVNLRELSLSRNKGLFNFHIISNLYRLESLMLSNCNIDNIEFLNHLTNLKKLSITNNVIKSIEPLKKLTQLVTLKIGKNSITDFSPLNNLRNLRILAINQNYTNNIGFLSNLRNLRELEINENNIEDISYIELLNNLVRLSLQKNNIRDIKGLVNLKKLEYLNLRHNRISDIQPLSKFSNLKNINLDYNEIKNIGKELLSYEIVLNKSRIRQLNKKYLLLAENPIETPPKEVVLAGRKAIINYYNEVEKEGEDYIYEMKLVLIGEERAGKTSICKSLSIDDYNLENEQSTQGIDVTKWNIDMKKTGFPKDLAMNIWDFGGQEIYHSTHQFFLTEKTIYLLVTEARKDIRHDDFYYWLNIVSILGGKSPVMIIQNKCDEPTSDIPFNDYKKSFDNIYGNSVINVSCKYEKKNLIENLKDEITKIVTNNNIITHLGTPLPKTWIKVRNRIEEMINEGINFMLYNEYLNLCKDEFISEKKAAYISEYFHDLGIFLHFRDNINLKDTIFLNHEWLTKGVYLVLDNQKIKDQKGRFNDADIIGLWGNYDEYKGKEKELINLMNNDKFQICYEISRGNYIAPQLLGSDEVPYEWNAENNLYFEYAYKFMPKGILAKLIYKLNTFLIEECAWRYGMIIEFDSTKALIKEKYFEKKISIQISGDNKRGLLEIIRKAIKEINNEFIKLEYEEMVACICQSCLANSTPHFYKYSKLKKRLDDGKETVECENAPYDDILIRDILDQTKRINKGKTKKIFISYSHKDKFYFDRLKTHLKALANIGFVFDEWADTRIKSGEKWFDEIKKAINASDIGILMISTDFLASDFIMNHEVRPLLKKAEENGKNIKLLVVGTCMLESFEDIAKFQAINPPDEPLEKYGNDNFNMNKIYIKLMDEIKNSL